MLQEWARFLLFPHPIERHDPGVHVSVIRGLRIVCNEPAIGGPVTWKFRTFGIGYTLGLPAAQHPAEQAHPPIIPPAKQNLAAVRRPYRSEFGLGNIRIGKAGGRALAQQIQYPNRRACSAWVFKPVDSHVSLVR